MTDLAKKHGLPLLVVAALCVGLALLGGPSLLDLMNAPSEVEEVKGTVDKFDAKLDGIQNDLAQIIGSLSLIKDQIKAINTSINLGSRERQKLNERVIDLERRLIRIEMRYEKR